LSAMGIARESGGQAEERTPRRVDRVVGRALVISRPFPRDSRYRFPVRGSDDRVKARATGILLASSSHRPPPSFFLSPRVSRGSTASGNERPTSSRTRGEPHARFPAASDISAFCGIASEDRRRILVVAYSAPLRQILRPRSNAASRITIARTSSRCADNAPRETASRPWLRSAVCAGYFPFPRGYSRSRSRASPARIPVGSWGKRIVILVGSSDGRAPSSVARHGEIRIDSAELANTEYGRSTDRI